MNSLSSPHIYFAVHNHHHQMYPHSSSLNHHCCRYENKRILSGLHTPPQHILISYDNRAHSVIYPSPVKYTHSPLVYHIYLYDDVDDNNNNSRTCMIMNDNKCGYKFPDLTTEHRTNNRIPSGCPKNPLQQQQQSHKHTSRAVIVAYHPELSDSIGFFR